MILCKNIWGKCLGKNGESRLWSRPNLPHAVTHKCELQFVSLQLQWFFLKKLKKKHILNMWKVNIAFSLKWKSEGTTFNPKYSARSLPRYSDPSRRSSSWVSANRPRDLFLPARFSLNFHFRVACGSLLLSVLYFCKYYDS